MAEQRRFNKIRRQKEVYAFIDNQNLNMTITNLGWKIDWQKFRRFLRNRYGVTKAFMFIGYVPEQEEMYKQLHAAGYAIVLKPTFDMTRPQAEENGNDEEKEKRAIKGNVDADLVLWVMKEMKNYDKAVIITGDGDFFSLVEYLKQQNKLQKLLTPTWKYSSLFKPFKEDIERIDQHRNELSYRPRKKPQDGADSNHD